MITCKEIMAQLIFDAQEATAAFFKMQQNRSNYSIEEINKITLDQRVTLGSFNSFMCFVNKFNVEPGDLFCSWEDYA